MTEPVLDVVGDLLGRADDHAVAAAASELADQRAHRQVPPSRRRQRRAEEGVVAIGRHGQIAGQRRIELQSLGLDAERAGKTVQAVVPWNQVDQRIAPLPRLRLGGADDGGQARQDLDRIHTAPQRFGARIDGALVRQRLVERLRCRKHGLGMARGELAAIVGTAGLEQHRMALRRPWQVQRTVHVEERAMMADRLQHRGIDEAPAGLVTDEGVVLPAVPQRLDQRREFVGARVALAVIGRGGPAEIARRARIGGRHHIPSGAPATDMVQRRKTPRDVVGLVVAGRYGGHQPDMRGRGGDAGQQQRRLQRGDRTEMDLVGDRRVVGKEDRIELCGLRDACQAHVVLHVDEGARIAGGQAPGRRHEAGMQGVDVQMQLARRCGRCHRGSPIAQDMAQNTRPSVRWVVSPFR